MVFYQRGAFGRALFILHHYHIFDRDFVNSSDFRGLEILHLKSEAYNDRQVKFTPQFCEFRTENAMSK